MPEIPTHIQIVPLNNKGFIHGYPGLPANTKFERGASIKGEVQISLPLVGVAASSIELRLQKTESIAIHGRKSLNSAEVLGKWVIWEENQYRQQNVFNGNYPFSIPLGEDLPPTVALDKQGIEIRYSMTATVYRANKLSWSAKPLSCTQPLLMEKYDNHPAWPMYHNPQVKSVESGSIRLSARCGRTCYGPGETISLTAILVIGSHRVIPRHVKFDLKFEEEVTVIQKAGLKLWSGFGEKPIKRLLARHSTTCAKSEYSPASGFTAGLSIKVPKQDVRLTLTTAAHIRVAYNLIVFSEVHSENLRVELPIIISQWTSDGPEEIMAIGPVPSLGGTAQLDKLPAYPGSESTEHIPRTPHRDSVSRAVASTPNLLVHQIPDYAESLPPRNRARDDSITTDITPPRIPLEASSSSEYAESSIGRARSDFTLDNTPESHDRVVRYPLSARSLRRTTVSSNFTLISEDNTLACTDYGTSPNILSGSKPLLREKADSLRPIIQITEMEPGAHFEEEDIPPDEEDEEVMPQSTSLSHNPDISGNEEKNSTLINVQDYIEDLMVILRSSEKTKALLELRGSRAQSVVDFLDLVLLELDSSMTWLRKHTLVALYRLCKASHLYPKCYTLHNIKLVSQEAGGGFADIHRGKHENQILCLKVVRVFQKTRTEDMLKVFAKEAVLWSHLNHPNILPFYGIYYLDQDRQRMCLVSPWMENGNLVAYLHDNQSVSRRPFAYDVIMGLEYLHDNRIVHGDLKGVNVLVTATGRACIADFGLSSVLIERSMATTAVTSAIYGGTYRWVAPELLEDGDSHPTRASDIWAFGCVCYQILTREVPFHEVLSDPAVIARVLKRGLPTRPTRTSGLDGIDDEMWLLMKRCWSFNSEHRPTCRQILALLGLVGMANRPTHDTQSSLRTAEFRNAMRTSNSVPIDQTVVRQVFDEIKEMPEEFN